MQLPILPRGILAGLSVLALTLVGACGTEGGSAPTYAPYQPDPAIGTTDFVSAAGTVGARSDDATYAPAEPSVGTDQGANERTVEEGDIYRVLGDGIVLNLNSYRGLQVIDLSDPAAPAITGKLRLSGYPVEMYVVGDRAVVLMNNWRAYYGSLHDPAAGTEEGGAVVLVDLSDPTAPAILDRATMRGDIRTSRLTTGGGQTALYVAASMWAYAYDGVPNGGVAVGAPAVATEDRTVVKSFEVGASALTDRTELDLGGWISDIQATTDALLVARTQGWGGEASKVAIIDISDPSGTMVQGAEVTVAGQVFSQFNMDLHGSVLRVVSGSQWGGSEANHIQTFDVTDIQAPAAIDHETFGDGQDLFATLFLGNKAFFVTYRRQDPFHAFEITDAGDATEKSEFIVSGWNDFFKPAFAETRLIGAGVDDADGSRSAAISLYDITDLTNAEPLVARADIGLQHSWSEASWDHRAFTVLEGAVSVAAGEVTETGLVLLPFSGWDDDGYTSGVQIFTFSETTLTKRGVMAHDSPVRRTFTVDAGANTCANLSDTTLSAYDAADPDAPVLYATLDLAPSYGAILPFGDYAARLHRTTDYGWYRGDLDPDRDWQIDIIALGPAADPDTAAAVATIAIPAGASVTKVGADKLVVAVSTWQAEPNVVKDSWTTDITVWNLAEPTAPVVVGQLTTDGITPYSRGYYGRPSPAMDCFDCGGWYQNGPSGQVVGDAIVYSERVDESAPAGTRELCLTHPKGEGYSNGSVPSGGTDAPPQVDPVDPDEQKADEAPEGRVYVGEIRCQSENGGPQVCWGSILECTTDTWECTEVDPDAIGAVTECETQPFDRYWSRFSLRVLDLSDAAAPVLSGALDLPTQHQAMATVVDGSTLWASTTLPVTVEGDGRPYLKYYAHALDLTAPSAPSLGAPVNVPGLLLAADGSTLFLQDFVYNDTVVESAVSRATVSEGLATLDARHRFGERTVQQIRLDGAGHVLVTHQKAYSYDVYDSAPTTAGVATATATPSSTPGKADGADDDATKLTVLASSALGVLAETVVDRWATFTDAVVGRALFQVPGGLLVMNLDDPTAPYPQAWFATTGWPESLEVAGDTVLFAAGRYGVYSFNLDTFNLLPPTE